MRLLRGARALATGDDALGNLRLGSRLSETPLGLGRWAGWGLLPKGMDAELLDRQVRQILCIRREAVVFLPELMAGMADPHRRVSAPLPQPWRKRLRGLGLRPRVWSCRWQWLRAQRIFYVGGMAEVARRLRMIWRGPERPAAPYALCVNLRTGNLPAADWRVGDPIHTLGAWHASGALSEGGDLPAYIHIYGGAEGAHPSGLRLTGQLFPRVPGVGARLRASGLVIWRALMATLRWPLGAWWAPALLREAVLLEHLRALPAALRPTQARFTLDNALHRPLWSHWLDAHGGQTHLVWYSTNSEPTAPRTHRPAPPFPGMNIMDWPHHQVWTPQQGAFVASQNGLPTQAHVVGPIPLSDSNTPLPDLPEGCVAVFDVTPFSYRHALHSGLLHAFYTGPAMVAFLRQTHAQLRAAGLTMALKRKRFNPEAVPHYLHAVEALAEEPDVVMLDPEVNAARLLDAPQIVAAISAPFTSTALLARHAGKPSVYFEPTAQLRYPPRAAQGVRVIDAQPDLAHWLAELPGAGGKSQIA
ncbi:hypothetical protein MAIT1_02654 [Magnetofaba australis IT-1]|uniref:Uncharacterized protein n=1 Tax=Magnetofaba australis IT-1 TaxID=1434232 RepID=A0A1Y2K5W8_9PROT|nr:hypothetical protein MAIT1_02654 [Magnetofaba australis IT-1]